MWGVAQYNLNDIIANFKGEGRIYLIDIKLI